MIDIHTHILPGIDDGPEDMAETLAMCRIAVEDGITDVVATPHMLKAPYDVSRDAVLEKVADLNARLSVEGIPLTIHKGAEIAISPEIPGLLREGRLLTLAGRGTHVFLELTDIFLSDPVEALIRELVEDGVTPVISHPERNAMVQKDPGLLGRFREAGALFQVTAMSLTGAFGAETKKFTLAMLKDGFADFIASDAHSSQWRPPVLSKARRVAEGILGPRALTLFMGPEGLFPRA